MKRLEHLPINLYPLDPRQIKLTYFIGVRRGADLSPALKDLVEAFQAAELQEKIR
ncbi:hypothetical protein PF586_07520 [Lactobacillus delbrueckii]|uniref:LysR family transcriptional regulator n=1 Tax=Lactobacillus delbrueckii TaxID=1584 RepID=A0AAW5YYZ1_9LACO|nr:hypothetical protein [Lactobacillus delbrueckii]KRL78901.1 hypothetical protein FC09_GL001643 [Lactobacillus delbrueckii subsp. indicus DSM 15996]MCD5532406.1 hypothetical protein [Lactobacillus delbrueckii subsp. lactis]MDA3768302.1 hypothetical protein [Lactobacillus delbrueckii]GHN35848.1 hypothetical protein ME792_09740 [Lactobacillus delbrueckii]